MAAMNINSKKLKEMIENGKTFLVDFWAPWCPHCRKINPAYEQIAEQYAGVLDVVKVDMDENDNLWSELQVELIPTLRLYVDGKPIASTVAPESNVAIEEFLSGILPEQKKKTTHMFMTCSSSAVDPADTRPRCTQQEQGSIRAATSSQVKTLQPTSPAYMLWEM